MLRIKIEVDGAKELDRKFSGLAEEISKPGDAWPEVAKEFRSIEREQFFTNGHGKWKPLTRPYERWKEAAHPFMPIMRATDALYRSLVFEGAEGSIYQPSDSELVMGSSVRSKKGKPYPIYHQRGDGNNPERKLIDIREEDARRLFKPIVRSMAKKAQRAGFVQREIGEI